MRRVPSIRSAVVAIVALCSLIVVASASAAAWQGPLRISALGVNAGDATNPPQLAMGTRGDEAAGWWDPSGIILSRKLVGQAPSAPITVAPTAATSVYPGVDGAGNITAAWSVGTTTTIASWPASAATATTAPLPGSFIVNDLAVNTAGTVVIAGTDGVSSVVVGYRPAGGTFAFHTFTLGGGSYLRPRVAINAAGMAVVIFRDNLTGLWSSTRTATTDWIAIPEPVKNTGVADPNSINPSVAIDGAGNAFAAFAYTPAAGVATVQTALRPPTGGWQLSGDLSSNAATFTANYVTVAVNPSGAAILVWKQTQSPGTFANIQARYGSTGTGIWGPIETVNDAGADVPVAAIGNDGMAVVAWERETMAGNIGQARVRSPGAAGTFGDIHNLSAIHANYTKPSIGTDGLGDFAVVSAPYDGTAQHAILSVYDAAPPVLSTPTVSGTKLAGDPVTIAATATDAWSSVPAPVWTFGDGGSGTGTSVTHTYAAAGTYTVHVSVTDGSGNSTATDVSVAIESPQATLKSAKFSGRWKVSRVTGALTVVGAAPRAGTYVVDVFKGKVRKLHTSYKLIAGDFNRKLKLPAKFLPGTYSVRLIPGDAQVKGATLNASLAAPASGVVDVGFLSGARNGTAARTLTGARTIWASFHFAAKPKGSLTLTWYKLGKKRFRIGATSKSSVVKVVSFLRIGRTFAGTYQAVLSRKGVVIARASVKAKKR